MLPLPQYPAYPHRIGLFSRVLSTSQTRNQVSNFQAYYINTTQTFPPKDTLKEKKEK